MPTGTTIRRAVGRQINAVMGEEVLREIINSGTSASQITDATRLLSTRFSGQQFQDWLVREADASAAAPDGELTYARTLTPSTGVLTVSPSFSAALANADALELYSPKAPHPDWIDQMRDFALSEVCLYERIMPLAWAVDGDFALSGVTNWTGSSATPTKVEKSGLERFSEQTLRVLNSGANGYAGQTVNVPRAAGSGGLADNWFFHVLAQADVGTAQITFQDLTNSAALTPTGYRTSWSGEGFAVITGTVSGLATTEQISIRLGGSGASDDTYWANLCFYPTSAREFILPVRLVNRRFIGRFGILRNNQDWPYYNIDFDVEQPRIYDVSGGGLRVVFSHPVGTEAWFYQEYAHYAALQTIYNTQAGRVVGDAASTDCPLEYVKWATLNQLFPGQYEKQFQQYHKQYSPPSVIKWRTGRVFA